MNLKNGDIINIDQISYPLDASLKLKIKEDKLLFFKTQKEDYVGATMSQFMLFAYLTALELEDEIY